MYYLPKTVAMLLLTILSVRACAEVSLKNGNFFTGSKDIFYSGGFELKIERVYNSKTGYRGIFGNGWGNEYEVYLEVGGDGAVTVHEYGGGAENRFDSPAMTSTEIEHSVEQIVAVATAQGDLSGDQNSADYHNKLVSDAMFRLDEWRKYMKKKLLQSRMLPVGTRLTSSRFSYETVVVQRDGYRRDFDDGRSELYRKDGTLRQVSDRNGSFIIFSYDVPGQITIRDDLGRSMVLIKNERGLVTDIEGSGGESCSYRYNDHDELIYARDASGAEYAYEYDYDHRHNLTKITFADQTKMEILYYPYEQLENVRNVVDRDGTLTEYSYNTDKQDLHYTVTSKVSNAPDEKGKRSLISTSSYEYFNQIERNGEHRTIRMITVSDGYRTDTTYDDNGLPTRIEQGKKVTSFVYDNKGHVTQKKSPEETTDLTYESACSKVNYVRRSSTKTGQILDESRFTYDENGNLLTASSLGKLVKLQYDSKGRVSELDSNDGVRIKIDYNLNSKPVKISSLEHSDSQGKIVPTNAIRVTYTPSGEIDHVESDGGQETALVVTRSFQELLDLIRPAGVKLSF